MTILFVQQRKPRFLIPFLVEHSFAIVGAIFAVYLLIMNPSDEMDESFEGYQTLIIICVLFIIALSVHSWLVIYTLHQEYTESQVIILGGPYSNVTVHPIIAAEPRVATVENGIVLTQQYDSAHGRR